VCNRVTNMVVPSLIPTSYHREVRATLRTHEPGLWSWYASDKFGDGFEKLARKELRLTNANLSDLRRRWPSIQEQLAKSVEG
jgi:hypothetical protein